MSFLFKMPSMPPMPPIEEPKVEDVPSAEDEARKAAEAAGNERLRNRNRKGRRSTILTSPDYEDTAATTKQNTLLGG